MPEDREHRLLDGSGLSLLEAFFFAGTAVRLLLLLHFTRRQHITTTYTDLSKEAFLLRR